MTAAKSVDSSKPNYIIVFRDASPRNTSTMSTLLNRTASVGVRSRAERVSLLQAGDSGVMPRIYETIGVAAADLTDEQVETLRNRDDVATVAVNQVRYLPPVVRSRGNGDDGFGGAAPMPLDPYRAYLMGVRDTAGAALDFLDRPSLSPRGGSATATAAAPALAPSNAVRATWGLRAMGILAPHVSTGRDVKVAVLDTGIDLHHRDMGRKVIAGLTARSFVDNISVQDVDGHGTHCAGTVAGPLQSVSGMRYGVAPDAQLLVGKVFNNDPRPRAFDGDIFEAIQWADENGARVVSLSLGSARRPGEAFADCYEELAVVMRNRAAGSVLLVAAAGNESNRPFSVAAVGNPAACPSIAAVGAVDRHDQIAPFSCRQLDNIGEVNISGPGVGIFSSTTNDSFETLDGTSMATPHIAGLAALILEMNPAFSARQVLDAMLARARTLGDPRDFGAGFARF